MDARMVDRNNVRGDGRHHRNVPQSVLKPSRYPSLTAFRPLGGFVGPSFSGKSFSNQEECISISSGIASLGGRSIEDRMSIRWRKLT
jgi:hypothetical protein